MTIAHTTGSDDYRKSSYSTSTDSCVEVHRTIDTVRDSKNPGGPTLSVAGLPAFVGLVKNDKIGPAPVA